MTASGSSSGQRVTLRSGGLAILIAEISILSFFSRYSVASPAMQSPTRSDRWMASLRLSPAEAMRYLGAPLHI